MDDKSRRDFLRTGWKLSGALLIGAASYTGYEALRPLASGAGGAKLTVGTQEVPEEFTLWFRRRCRVARRADGQLGVQFVQGS